MLKIKDFRFNPLRTNCYVLRDDGDPACAIVDPGCADSAEIEALTDYISRTGLRPECILLTHGHFDHILGVNGLVGLYGVPVYMHPSDRTILSGCSELAAYYSCSPLAALFATEDLAEGTVLRIGDALTLSVVWTPGHTPGGVCYYDEGDGVLLSGDTLFAGSIGRTDMPGGSYDDIIRSIMDRLMGLPGGVDVLPGHGPSTTIAREAMQNPFLIPFNEPAGEAEPLYYR